MATALSLESVNDVDIETKLCVHGYIRRIQKLLPDDNVYFTIPKLAIHWIILYYYVCEQFDPNHCHSEFELSADNTILKKLSMCRGTAYLSKKIKSGIHVWRFKLVDKVGPGNLTMGV